MAQEKDITRRPKFFTRKKGCKEELLCEKCKHHRHIIMVKFGCDALMFSDTKLKGIADFLHAVNGQKYIHFWCVNTDDPPSCLEQFKEAGAIR